MDKVVAVLVARDVDERDPGSAPSALADPIQIPAQKVPAADLETLLDNLGGKLVGAVLGCVANDVIDGPASVRGSSVLANVLDAPVSELAVCHDVDVGEDILNAGALVFFEAILENALYDEAARLA